MPGCPQQGCPTAVHRSAAASPSRDGNRGEEADHAGGRGTARHGAGVRRSDVVGASSAGSGHPGGRRAGGGGAGGAAGHPRHRAAAGRGLPARVLRRAVGGRRRQRLRHPQRRTGGVADRRDVRRHPPVRGGLGHAARPVHGTRRGVPARPGDQRRGADRPRGRARRRLAQGRGRVVRAGGARVRERPREPGADRRRGQPGQERRRCRHLAPAERRVPLCVRGAADLGQVRLRPRGHERGARSARGCARTMPAGTCGDGDVGAER